MKMTARDVDTKPSCFSPSIYCPVVTSSVLHQYVRTYTDCVLIFHSLSLVAQKQGNKLVKCSSGQENGPLCGFIYELCSLLNDFVKQGTKHRNSERCKEEMP